VGVHWFQYIDEPLTGRFDGENYNIGFVDVTDTPYPELRDAARRVNNTIYHRPSAK
jgi:agarase